MSLIRLLAVGRSVGTINDEPTRYKMTQEHLLPRFGPAKSGDEEAGQSAAMLHEPAEAPQLRPASLEAEARPAPGRLCSSARSLEQGVSAEEPSRGSTNLEQSNNGVMGVSGPRKATSPRKGWSLFRNPFQGKDGRMKPSAPVQAELALDMVRPVRNALDESDLEVVPARKKVAGSGSPFSAGTQTPKKRTGAFWGRLWGRLVRPKLEKQ